MRPDPERVRLAAEALARARADAWARGERPSAAARPPQPSSDSSERKGVAASGLLSPGWSARPRREDPQSLNAAVGGLLSARGWRQRAAVGAVFGGWAEIVGPQLAAHTRPESFDDGELVVSADSAAWATQVRLLAPQLLRRLAEELGAGTVRKVRVRGGTTARPPRRGPGGLRGNGQSPRARGQGTGDTGSPPVCGGPGGYGGRAVPPCAGGSGGRPPGLTPTRTVKAAARVRNHS
jgi:predicted nucleic acid-binding Zn ribbon protein